MASHNHSSNVSRRTILKATGAAALAGQFASIRGVSAQDAGTPEAQRGGTLRVGRLVDIQAPDRALMASPSYILTAQIYNALIRYDENQSPVPELAESWEQSDDGTQLKINLRQGVEFHTGREFTSEDVQYNLLRVRDPELGMSQLRTMSEWVTNVQVPDKYSIIFELDQPRPAILDLLGYLFIVDQETAEGPDAASQAVGTGPFTFAEWAPGDSLHLARFPNYWQSGRPFLDEVVVQVIGDAQSLRVQLESGAIDMAGLLPERDAAQLGQDGNFQLVQNDLSGQFYQMTFNTTLAPLGDKRVRQAINHSIDREYLVDELLSGIGEPSAIPWPPHSAAFDESRKNAYPYDLDRAKALLEEAGVGDFAIEMITSPAFPMLEQEGEILQADLASLGVSLDVSTPEQAAWSDATVSTTFGGLTAATFAYADLEPSSLLIMAAPWRPEDNYAGFQSDEYTQLVQDAATEMDASRRQSLYEQLTELILDESWVMPIAQRKGVLVMSPKVHDPKFRVNTSQVVRLEDAWVEA